MERGPYLISKEVQFEESRPTLHLCLDQCGRGHLNIATGEEMISEAGERERGRGRGREREVGRER